MTNAMRLVLTLATGAGLAPALAAQSLADVCRAVLTVQVGQWASYDVTGASSQGGKLRLAIVGSERSGDSTLFWLEMSFAGTDPNRSGVMQLLTSGLGAGRAATRALVVKVGTHPAVRTSGPMAAMMGVSAGRNNAAFDWAARCPTAHVVGWESVTVPAGTFRALHVSTDSGGEAWASLDVPFSLVKFRAKEGDVVLAARGAGAKSSITETPQEVPLLPGVTKKP